MEYFNLHTHHFTNNPEIFELVNQYPDEFNPEIPFHSVGIHPWRIAENRIESELHFIKEKLSEKNCLAIGECGLDKRIETPFDLQIEVFERQLYLAEAFQKPVIIHCVAAFQEIIEIKKKLKISVPMIIHGFSKNVQVAKNLINNGFYISFGKYLLRNPELGDVFKSVPNDQFFLETDTIDEGISEVYQLAAKYKDLELEALKKIITENFNSTFKKI
ncbi:TatD family hydrolase [Flavobacterium sp. 3HN19-14]|uniref:TatD family hydrolase n=1 Tax=Flavobacterium sp. 3HN19-14 TaxID=3448133 RepID=UPI003EE2F362